MKKILTDLIAGDEITRWKIDSFLKEDITYRDLQDFIPHSLPLLTDETLNKITDSYFRKNNDREFDLLFREYVLGLKDLHEMRFKVYSLAERILSEQVLNAKLKSFFLVVNG